MSDTFCTWSIITIFYMFGGVCAYNLYVTWFNWRLDRRNAAEGSRPVKRFLYTTAALVVPVIIAGVVLLIVQDATRPQHSRSCEQVLLDDYLMSPHDPLYQVPENKPPECASLTEEEYRQKVVEIIG